VFYTPQPDEIVWAREAASSDEHLLVQRRVNPAGV